MAASGVEGSLREIISRSDRSQGFVAIEEEATSFAHHRPQPYAGSYGQDDSAYELVVYLTGRVPARLSLGRLWASARTRGAGVTGVWRAAYPVRETSPSVQTVTRTKAKMTQPCVLSTVDRLRESHSSAARQRSTQDALVGKMASGCVSTCKSTRAGWPEGRSSPHLAFPSSDVTDPGQLVQHLQKPEMASSSRPLPSPHTKHLPVIVTSASVQTWVELSVSELTDSPDLPLPGLSSHPLDLPYPSSIQHE